jgi:hypothetical protein
MSRPIMAAPSMTTAAFLSDFMLLKYPEIGNKDFTFEAVTKHLGNAGCGLSKHC